MLLNCPRVVSFNLVIPFKSLRERCFEIPIIHHSAEANLMTLIFKSDECCSSLINGDHLCTTMNGGELKVSINFRRSRSVTPQSHTGTPPQSAQPNNLMNPNINSILSAPSHLGSNGNNSSSQRTELSAGPPLNYSEMMRTLAAKYNNNSNE